MADLYDEDILLWSERQAELLRRMAHGDRVNDQVDWENVAEEIVDVGRSELRAVASHLVQALLHDLKAEAWPLSREVPHWRAEARGHRDDARAAFTRSMAQREELEVAELYRRALRRMPDVIDGVPPLPVPAECPVTLEELLTEPEASGP
jgi:hypothetical protein